MYKKLTLTLATCLLMVAHLSSQETWSLQKCVQYAWENNITIKRTELNMQQSQLDKKASQMLRLPNLNGSLSGAYQFGRTIDPVTNEFNSLSIGTNGLRLDAGVTLYNGNRINNSIKQAGYDIQAAMNDLAQAKNDISLSIASAYLNVLFAEEQLTAAVQRKILTESQLDQVDKLIKAGVRPANDRLDILATIARNEQQIITQENAVETGMLNLKNILMLDPSKTIQLEKPNTILVAVDENPELVKLNDLYQSSLNNQPFVKADEFRVKSAALGKQIARASALPNLSAFAGLSSNYSTRFQQRDGTFSTEIVTQTVTLDGQQVDFGFTQEVPNFEDVSYFDQVNQNFGQNVGLSLRVPIYNNHTTIINMDRAEISVRNAQYAAELNRQNLKNDIQTALANARAAKRTLQAAQRTVEATQAAFQNSEKQFELGTINTFEYATAKNNLDQAEVDLIVAKYDYIFTLKVLDFYQGKKLELK
ncbi:MAG: TolC family protein [Bacteroidota bacterium]